jgi:hypothetical protein
MHEDASDPQAADDPERWGLYLARLRSTGRFDSGSAIGGGQCLRKGQASQPSARGLGGFIRVRAASLEDAERFLAGNPFFEAGGTVEIRELPQT